MEKIKNIAESFGIDEHSYSYETNSSSIVSLDIYEPEYYELDDASKINILKFAASFKFLTSLNISLYDFVIDDLSAFSDLIYLENLRIECDTDIKDLSFLKNMKTLKYLYIQSSNVNNISELKELNDLQSLTIGYSLIENLNPINHLKSLERLGFPSNKIKDLSAFEDLKFLKSIDLSNNEIENISIFSEYNNLEYLNLSSNQITDISSIGGNIDLKFLNVFDNNIKNINVLQNFSKIDNLYIHNNEIENIEILEKLINLNYLTISDNKITSLKSLNSHTNLKYLIANNNLIDDFSEVHFTSQLHYLSMENCGIKDLDFINNQKELRVINFNDNDIQDFSALQYCDFLNEIFLKNNNIKDNFPMHYFSKLELVDLSGNEFGNKIFVRYFGRSNHLENDPNVALVKDLQKLNADYYYNIGDNDSALAFYYYDDRTKSLEKFYLYLEKLLNTPSRETVYLKYYFFQIIDVIGDPESHFKLEQEDYDKLETKIKTVKEPEKIEMLNVLQNVKKGVWAFFRFNYLDFYFYERKVANPYIDDELIFLKGSVIVKRENLMTNLYFLKLLKQTNSPYYFNLFHKIKHVLEMNFAFTEQERKEHDYYLYLLHNLDSKDIIVQNDNFNEFHLDRSYQFTHYNFPDSKPKKQNPVSSFFSQLYFWILVIIVVVSSIAAIITFFKLLGSL